MVIEVLVDMVSLGRRVAVKADGGLGDIRRLLDEDGDETEDWEAACVAVVEWRGGGWSRLVLADFDFDVVLQ